MNCDELALDAHQASEGLHRLEELENHAIGLDHLPHQLGDPIDRLNLKSSLSNILKS